MSHSPEQIRKKNEARADAMEHMRNSAVDGKRGAKNEHEMKEFEMQEKMECK